MPEEIGASKQTRKIASGRPSQAHGAPKVTPVLRAFIGVNRSAQQ
jgi:hypothetical protein